MCIRDRHYIVFLVEEVLVDEAGERISPIEGEDAEISIPREVLDGLREGERVRMASFIFRNMSGLLPESLERADNNRLVVEYRREELSLYKYKL